MNDRELLEMAAKTAGIELGLAIYSGKTGALKHYLIKEDGDTIAWNPLTDDGDAFRLAAQLEMKVDFGHSDENCRAKCTAPRIHAEHIEPIVDDQLKAARFAIVRAAAEIGRQMK